MEMVNHKTRSRYGYVCNNPFQMCNSSHDLAPYDLAFFLAAALSCACKVTYEFVKIRGTGVLLLPIRVYPCASVVKSFRFRETLHFTTATASARMEKQQLARFE